MSNTTNFIALQEKFGDVIKTFSWDASANEGDRFYVNAYFNLRTKFSVMKAASQDLLVNFTPNFNELTEKMIKDLTAIQLKAKDMGFPDTIHTNHEDIEKAISGFNRFIVKIAEGDEKLWSVLNFYASQFNKDSLTYANFRVAYAVTQEGDQYVLNCTTLVSVSGEGEEGFTGYTFCHDAMGDWFDRVTAQDLQGKMGIGRTRPTIQQMMDILKIGMPTVTTVDAGLEAISEDLLERCEEAATDKYADVSDLSATPAVVTYDSVETKEVQA